MKRHARRLKVHDSINADRAISGHVFQEIDPGFADKVKKGDVLVAGEHFGCGSSCEEAPRALRASGLDAIVAKSFARVFYRNAFNAGLTLVECNTDFIDDGDEVELDIDNGTVLNRSKGLLLDGKPLPPFMKALLRDGGIIAHCKKHGGYAIE